MESSVVAPSAVPSVVQSAVPWAQMPMPVPVPVAPITPPPPSPMQVLYTYITSKMIEVPIVAGLLVAVYTFLFSTSHQSVGGEPVSWRVRLTTSILAGSVVSVVLFVVIWWSRKIWSLNALPSLPYPVPF